MRRAPPSYENERRAAQADGSAGFEPAAAGARCRALAPFRRAYSLARAAGKFETHALSRAAAAA
jgi:hypothetical protein